MDQLCEIAQAASQPPHVFQLSIAVGQAPISRSLRISSSRSVAISSSSNDSHPLSSRSPDVARATCNAMSNSCPSNCRIQGANLGVLESTIVVGSSAGVEELGSEGLAEASMVSASAVGAAAVLAVVAPALLLHTAAAVH